MNYLLESIAATLLILPSLFGIAPTPEPTPTPTSSPEQVESPEPMSSPTKSRPTPSENPPSSKPSPTPPKMTPTVAEPSPEPEPTYTKEVYAEPTHIEEDEYVAESPEPVATETEEPVYDSRWDTIAECESGGDWSINTGNNYFGGVQHSKTSWDAMGGQEFAAYPHQASKEEQIIVAERLLEVQGWGAWPTCGKVYSDM